ncbi:hypothetical protein PENTCL1PPCAC_26445 [Pristionchus entomophagus]|uniref:Uncharacterized protein n=1 Tax=Pristionchus entomophagus TaxID=358040 RepID=A0AAV5UBI1_9BILA|nr:hypothetical protein PENTCL1PPCAC_26445 [Pristionchus entomophagus]
MKEEKDKKFLLTMEHLSFSWCYLRKTTLESISTEKEHEKVIGRAINVYKVVLHDFTPPEIRAPLGLQIRYDARERIEIFSGSQDDLFDSSEIGGYHTGGEWKECMQQEYVHGTHPTESQFLQSGESDYRDGSEWTLFVSRTGRNARGCTADCKEGRQGVME